MNADVFQQHDASHWSCGLLVSANCSNTTNFVIIIRSNSQKTTSKTVITVESISIAGLCSSWPMNIVAIVKPTFGKMNAVMRSVTM